MMNIHFEGAKEISKPPSMTHEQCSSAWAMAFTQEIEVQGTDQKMSVGCWLMMYQPSKEDIEAIVAGQPICLKIMSERLTPHALWTHNAETGEPNF